MDVNAVAFCEPDNAAQQLLKDKAAMNMKRVIIKDDMKWSTATAQSPYMIMDFQEIKTTWHPIENIGGAKAGY